MKPKKHLLLLPLLAFFLNSCATNNDAIPEFSVFDISDKNQITEIHTDSIAERISITMLDNSSGSPILGNILNLHESDSSYYLLSDGIVYEYGKDGKFIRQIGAKGRGPGEYMNIQEIASDNSRIYLFDYNYQSILVYGKDGKFLYADKPDTGKRGTYISSFFKSGDSMILYSSTNSSSQDIYKYDLKTHKMDTISKRNREMAAGEIIMDRNFMFGNSNEPYVYTNFNDTVYVLKHNELVPSFLMTQGQYRFEYSELTMEKLMNLKESRLSIKWIASAGNYMFVSYTVTAAGHFDAYLGLYNTATGEYFQNIKTAEDEDSRISISAENRLYKAKDENELMAIKPVSESYDEYAIIKYRMK